MTKYSNYKSYFLRKNYFKNQKFFFLLKSLLLNQSNSKKIRFKIMLQIDKIYNTLFNNKFHNRCIFSSKIRSIDRLTNLTKSTLKRDLSFGKIVGFKKSSW